MAVRYEEFLSQVLDRGEYPTPAEAERVTHAVLDVLAQRILATELEDLAAQLPEPLRGHLRQIPPTGAESFDLPEFCRRVSAKLGTRPGIAEWDASAVLSTVAEAVSEDELQDVLAQLPSDYPVVFGRPELTS